MTNSNNSSARSALWDANCRQATAWARELMAERGLETYNCPGAENGLYDHPQLVGDIWMIARENDDRIPNGRHNVVRHIEVVRSPDRGWRTVFNQPGRSLRDLRGREYHKIKLDRPLASHTLALVEGYDYMSGPYRYYTLAYIME